MRLRDTIARRGTDSKISMLESKALRSRILNCLQKPPGELTELEKAILADNKALTRTLSKYWERKKALKKRREEIEDDETIVIQGCHEVAQALRDSSHAVVYTGAGVSTSANIPDYRGPDGVWTAIKRGQDVPELPNLTTVEPTESHMCLRKLVDEGIVKHVVSQNCDGLHLRSGIPQHNMSEIHGNMYIEICNNCNFEVHYRIFDVTTKTSLHRHQTDRVCAKCGEKLKDTIVHFGERSNLRWPHNWEGAIENASKSDLILCLGSSLKVLRSYKQLWMMNRPKHKRPKLYIVNLQWTPKDSQAKLKLHSRVDFVMSTVTNLLGFDIPKYSKEYDPLFSLAAPCGYHGEMVPIPPLFASKFQTKVKCELISMESVKDDAPEQENDTSTEKFCSSLPRSVATGVAVGNSTTPAWFGKGIKAKRSSSRQPKRRRKSVKS